MNKKILIGSVLAVLLVTISYTSAIAQNEPKPKESPLYRIRTRNAISEKITEIVENIRTKLFGERSFFLPATLLKGFLPLSSNSLLSIGDSACGSKLCEPIFGGTLDPLPICDHTGLNYLTCQIICFFRK